MKAIRMIFSILLLAGALCLTALAQQRTWVSGVGNDANPCNRTQPCQTFAGAISKTAAGGEIDVLDPSSFGPVTITKSISIVSFTIAGVLPGAGVNGIVISAPSNSVVVLKGLTLDGMAVGADGIKFLSGEALYVENCAVNNFTGAAIDFTSSTTASLFVKDTTVRNNTGGGIWVHPTGGASVPVAASIDHVRSEGNLFGFKVEENANVSVRDSIAASNAGNGFFVTSNTGGIAVMELETCSSVNNGTDGVRADNTNATARISNMRINHNAIGILANGGQIYTFGDNKNADTGTPNQPPTGKQ
jgi:hypothetical protein